MFQPSLFSNLLLGFFCFSQQTLPNTPSREGKLSVHQHFDAPGTYFSKEESKWVTSLWPQANATHACLDPIFRI